MKKIIIAMAGIIYCQLSFSQTKDFHFRRKISTTDSAGWYSLTVPGDVFKNLNDDFSDLRVYQFNANDTVESPYLLKIHQQEISEEVFHPAAFNQSKKEGSQFFSFELPKGAQINFIDLSFDEINFDGFATIEGSDDQKSWFEIEKRQRIISIVNPNISFYSGIIHFGRQRFRFIRVKVETDKTLTLKEATFKDETIRPAVESKVDAPWSVDVDRKAKQTIIKVNLKTYQPLVELVVEANEKVDYYRTFRLEKLTDSVSTPKGWQYYYSTVAQGYLTSLDSNRFVFSYSLARKLRMVIEDADNTPLNIKSISLYGPEVELITRMTKGDHYLFYGNNQAHTPNYDLINFKDKIPLNARSLALGEEEKMTQEAAPISALIQNKIWLWVLMGVVIAVLAFFTMRMMKERQ